MLVAQYLPWYAEQIMRKKSKRILIFFLSLMIGTLCWELLVIIISYLHISLPPSLPPIGFDAHVLAVSICFNIGSIIGGIIGYLLIRNKK